MWRSKICDIIGYISCSKQNRSGFTSPFYLHNHYFASIITISPPPSLFISFPSSHFASMIILPSSSPFHLHDHYFAFILSSSSLCFHHLHHHHFASIIITLLPSPSFCLHPFIIIISSPSSPFRLHH